MSVTPQSFGGPPRTVLATFVAFSAACFTGAFVFDLVYWRSTSYIWETFSVWLLTAGLIVAAFAVVAGLIGYVGGRHRRRPVRWLRVIASAVVIVLSIINAFVHSRDGYTAVVPTGLTLSAVVCAIMIVVALSAMLTSRQRTGEFA